MKAAIAVTVLAICLAADTGEGVGIGGDGASLKALVVVKEAVGSEGRGEALLTEMIS